MAVVDLCVGKKNYQHPKVQKMYSKPVASILDYEVKCDKLMKLGKLTVT